VTRTTRTQTAFLPFRIVTEYTRLVVFRLGRMTGVKGPGVVAVVPLVDRLIKVDLREFFLEIPRQTAITKDNAPISIDFITFFKVVDVQASVVQVADFSGAAQNIAATTLRSVVGDISLDDVLAKRDEINQLLRAKLDDVTERWGVKVTNVEIREITPPPAVQEAMTRQMSAERTRRAVVTEAEGDKAAAILRAEGDKQSNILQAEGEKQSNILQAEGDKQAAALRAEGFALALTKVYESAQGVDAKTMGLQYLDALKSLGASPSTKFVLPLELSSMLQGLAGYVGDGFHDGDRSPARAK
jgi:regulator of protease activity HflC (stomatin/prohibitin superfamily)